MARIITIITSPIQKRLIALFDGLYVGAKVRPNVCSQVYYKPDFESRRVLEYIVKPIALLFLFCGSFYNDTLYLTKSIKFESYISVQI